MPDPLLYLQAAAIAFVASAGWVGLGCLVRFAGPSPERGLANVLAIGCGACLGLSWLDFEPVWPPSSALDRLLLIVWPAVFMLEAAAATFPGYAKSWQAARAAVALLSGRALLLGSGYLQPSSDWAGWPLAALLLGSAVLFALVWMLLQRLDERSPGISLPLSVAIATGTAGLLVMLGGYIKGGAVSVPLAAALAGAGIASSWISRAAGSHRGALGVGTAGLFGVLFVGRWFGELSTTPAMVVLLAPLLAWLAELPWIRRWRTWQIELFRIAVVLVPLVILLVLAKREFDLRMGTLLE